MRIALAFFGAGLMVLGVAAHIIGDRHRPQVLSVASGLFTRKVRWSPTTFDAVRVGSFALLTFGAVIVALALVREYRQTGSVS